MSRRGKREKKPRENRYAALNAPQAELDFHGSGPILMQEVRQRTIRFVAKSERAGCHRLRIITGKGLHSKDGPKVRPQVERTLKELMKDGAIRTYYPEKDSEGGSGAFVVEI